MLKVNGQYLDADVVLKRIGKSYRETDLDKAFELAVRATDLAHRKSVLIEKMSNLQRTLERAVDQLENDDEYSSINSLGEVQGSGSAIDVACALYVVEREKLERYIRKNHCGVLDVED